MSIELSMLNLFCGSREIEMAHYGYIDTLDNMERELKLLFGLVHTYYKEYETDSIGQDELLNFYDVKYPKAKAREMHVDLIKGSFEVKVSPELVKKSLDQMIERHTATKIINKLLPVMEGQQFDVLDSIRTDVDEYVELLHNPPDSISVPVPCTLSVQALVDQEILDDGYSWHLPLLTKIIGGVRMKTLGLIYAYVDSGKTSFSLAAAAAFAKIFAGGPSRIAYAGNEESAERLRLRFVQALTNWNRSTIRDNAVQADDMAMVNGLTNVDIFDDITSGAQIKHIVKHYNPSILFVDQATDVDVNTKRKSDGVDYLKILFKWYRRLSSINNIAIITVAQGVATAENAQWLKLSDIYYSKVAIQGSLDYAIGIGRKLDDPAMEDLRFINIPKNKLADGDGGKFTTHFTRQTCYWSEV
jgi:hypothetical protein